MHRRTFLASAGTAVAGAEFLGLGRAGDETAQPDTVDVALFQTRRLTDAFADADDATRWQAADRCARIVRSALAASGLDARVRAAHDAVDVAYDGDSYQTLADWQAVRHADALAADANLLLTADGSAAYEEGRAGIAYRGSRWALVHFGRAFRHTGERAPWLWAPRGAQSVGGGVAVHEVGHCLGLTHADGDVTCYDHGQAGPGVPAGAWTAVSPMAGNYYPEPGVADADWPAAEGPLVRERRFGPAARATLTDTDDDSGDAERLSVGAADVVACPARPASAALQSVGTAAFARPRDPDGDGRVADVTGDGTVDDADARALLDALEHPVVARHARAFGFAGGDADTVTVRDVAALLDHT